MKRVTTVLFCQSNSIYNKLGRLYPCDTWNEKRNALNWQGNEACVYHPPCRLWSKLKNFSTADENEKYLAVWSVRKIQEYGGVLEHPAYSSLWKCCNLPKPGKKDQFGFTIEVDQFHFGHKAQKKTWLYIVGLPINSELLHYRKIPGKPKFQVSALRFEPKPRLNKKLSNATPKKFAKFIVKIVDKINNLKNRRSAKEIPLFRTDRRLRGVRKAS